MQFIDRITIKVTAGTGGHGKSAFRREKFVAKGGPSGGDGGRGGDIVFRVDNNMNTLLDFRFHRKFVAKNGENGDIKNQYGHNAPPCIVKVPQGTLVKDADTGETLADLTELGQEAVIAKGGRGGRGNAKFANSANRAPTFAELGEPGEVRNLLLELKLLADVGLVGYPSVGKSSLVSKVSAARPEIAEYHFTTITPVLGVVNVGELGDEKTFVMADIPGIIEGAAEGVGLGLDFLRHIERTRLLIHVVDISGVEGRDAFEDFVTINEELKKYSVKLWDRPQIIVANKADMLYDELVFEDFKKKVNELGFDKVFKMSAATKSGVEEVIKEAGRMLTEIPVMDLEIPEEERYVEQEKRFTYEINVEEGEEYNTYVVTGSFVDRLLASVNIHDADSLRYFHKVLNNKGVLQQIRDMGVQDGDMVRLNDFEFEYIL